MHNRDTSACKYFFLALLLGGAPGLFLQAQAPTSPPGGRGLASVTIGGKKLSIDYGRPQLRGRDVMSMASPGTVWRMGMNEATQLDTTATLKFRGLTVKPGKYSLWAKKVSDREWTLIVNKKTGQWGTEYDAGQDLGTTPLAIEDLKEPVEAMTISLSEKEKEGLFELTWGTRKLSANFTAE